MKILLRTMFVLAAAALTAITGAGVAAADGPDTDPQVANAIELQKWVEFGPGDENYRIAFVRCYLAWYGDYGNCNPTAGDGDVYHADMEAAVEQFKASHDLPQNSTITTEMWEEMRLTFSNDPATDINDPRHPVIEGIQHTMNVLLPGADINVDGLYGAQTDAAVRKFQTDKGIDADGDFGWYTFRAAFAQGAEQSGTPGL